MEDKDWASGCFLQVLRNKYTERGKLVQVLLEILPLEREALYRRLRGEVDFSFSEIVAIAEKLDISLDNIISQSSSKNRPFQLRLIDFENPCRVDIEMQYHLIDIFKAAAKDPSSEYASASNLIPMALCLNYNYIYRFHRMKWFYQCGTRPWKYKDVILSDMNQEMTRALVDASRNIAHTYFVWAPKIIPALIEDILYFECVRLIEKEEVAQLKEELLLFLRELEEIAVTGVYPETGKRIDLYISSMNYETEFLYYKSNGQVLSSIRLFTLNDMISQDLQVYEKINRWLHSLIRTSTLISATNEMDRFTFFREQRKLIETSL